MLTDSQRQARRATVDNVRRVKQRRAERQAAARRVPADACKTAAVGSLTFAADAAIR